MTANWLEGVTEKLIPTSLGLINVRVGGRSDGPAMVCWPSLMMDGTMWQYQYEHFAPTHRVVLIDSPGHGKSDALRKIIDLRDCTDALVEILDALGIDQCVLVGNSWRGMLAGVFPAHYPQRTAAAVGINCTASLPTTVESIWATALATFLSLHAKMPTLAAKAARAAFAGPTAEATNPEFTDFTRFVLRDDPKSVAWALRSILIGRTDEHRLLNTIRNVPVLIIAGEEDSQFPVHVVRKMAERHRGQHLPRAPAHGPPRRSREPRGRQRRDRRLPPCPQRPDQETSTMADTAHAMAAPDWVLKFMDAIDTLDFGEGFAPLTEDTEMFFGTEHIHGAEAIKAFFVKIDEPLNITHEVLEYWTAGNGVRLLRGEATMAKKSAPDQVVRAPFMHIFYLDGEDPVRIRTLRITAGPLRTDAVM